MPRKAKSKGPVPDSAARSAVQPRSSVQAVAAPTGLPQGEHKALVDAQQNVQLPDINARIQMAIDQVNNRASGQVLGGGQMLAAPTAYPNEPVTAGLPVGPGAGPEALQPIATPVSLEDSQIAKYLPMLETLADQPNVSFATRAFVRSMRGQLPPQVTMESIVQRPQ